MDFDAAAWQERAREAAIAWRDDLIAAAGFLTRLPVAGLAAAETGLLARSMRALPLVGIVVGVAGWVMLAIAAALGLPATVGALLAVATTVLATGALHEDGLADTADGLGGGKDRESKLEIMRDSRIGSYGTCALMLSLMLRWSALAEIAEPRLVAVALIAAHVSARAVLPIVMSFVPP